MIDGAVTMVLFGAAIQAAQPARALVARIRRQTNGRKIRDRFVIEPNAARAART